MRTDICYQLGIEFPIFAFTHCRDVAAAVSKAGGLGVLGAVGFDPDQLEVELAWLDEHVGELPYGVDIVIPSKYEGMDLDLSPAELEAELARHIPREHRDFGARLLADHGVARIQSRGKLVGALCGSVRHALRHRDAALDFVVCQGTEGGGHCGEVASVVLWPQVIDAVDPLPVLAAGGIANGRQVAAALAMGAAGARAGALGLPVQEAHVPPAQVETY